MPFALSDDKRNFFETVESILSSILLPITHTWSERGWMGLKIKPKPMSEIDFSHRCLSGLNQMGFALLGEKDGS